MLVRNLKYTTYLKQCHYTKLCFGIIIYLIYKLNCKILYDNRLGIFSQENVSQNTDTVSIEGLDTIRNYTDDYAAIGGLNVLGARGGWRFPDILLIYCRCCFHPLLCQLCRRSACVSHCFRCCSGHCRSLCRTDSFRHCGINGMNVMLDLVGI